MRVLIAGGGSGGHISPGLAIAEALDGQALTHFICSARPVDQAMLEHSGRPFTTVTARPPSVHPISAARFVRAHLHSCRTIRRCIETLRIDAVILMGGFVSVPAASAARRLRIPTLLLNLDCVPGRANRWLAPRVTRCLAAVPTVTPFCDEIVGMPIRRAAVPPGDQAHCRRELGLDPDRPVLLVTGASQGAGTINALVPACARDHRALFDGWQVWHLSGVSGETPVTRAWHDAGIDATVEPFRHDMGLAWGAADLVISRAGAGSLAEIQAAGVPAIVLPYPHHRDRHQWHNARDAVAAGAVVLVEDHSDLDRTLPALSDALASLMPRGSTWRQMLDAAQGRRASSASQRVADAVVQLLK